MRVHLAFTVLLYIWSRVVFCGRPLNLDDLSDEESNDFQDDAGSANVRPHDFWSDVAVGISKLRSSPTTQGSDLVLTSVCRERAPDDTLIKVRMHGQDPGDMRSTGSYRIEKSSNVASTWREVPADEDPGPGPCGSSVLDQECGALDWAQVHRRRLTFERIVRILDNLPPRSQSHTTWDSICFYQPDRLFFGLRAFVTYVHFAEGGRLLISCDTTHIATLRP